ncbi:conserved Plasmodium protein, unknown function [Plasmodium berghei]|uniref:Uncharacterized protein n=2 Tax=Plasmodium berghei TaxID=5821 RepID=A0A509AR70_PLABA|nr:conserved Plasmodium protein, unknown function [Plasmodium berghei ANKA]CXI52890.1 conserved Plasmodium protein, unknown function [Plasmodium berghei]SCL94707.1 conserved Plasmodium protein, unknown function [Plasmodium berghei]SCM16084.1 conserved Plasmodium protein, unknown function [Plasmodium berghei]SCM17879.1 conserved Plasmodium protein, unknown function [Plasmodium berghei]SCN26201.1 conserved Plasmodium protein, unknown function [Plasmodium berghei]|eukprot:XP_034422007.1 conserved Plasmodium protein, unknown function [Plasmodium berghei ANKA]
MKKDGIKEEIKFTEYNNYKKNSVENDFSVKTNKNELEEENIKTKMNSNNEFDENILYDFVIDYYEWNSIPNITNLPYGLINKDNNDILKKYQKTLEIVLDDNKNSTDIQKEINIIKDENSDFFCVHNFSDIIMNSTCEKASTNLVVNNNNYEWGNENAVIRDISIDIFKDIVVYLLKMKEKVTKLKKINIDKDSVDKVQNNSISVQINQKINVEKNEEEMHWTKDFTCLANIQILGKNSDIFKEWCNLKFVIPYIINYCYSPRSCISKNGFLTIKHLCISVKRNELILSKFFSLIFPYIIKKLDIKNHFLNTCATNAISEFVINNTIINNFEILRLICTESNNINSSISMKMGYLVYQFLNNLSIDNLKKVNLSDFSEPFINFMNAKLPQTKEYIKKTFLLFLNIQSEDQIISQILTGIKGKQNLSIIEKQIRNLLRNSNTFDQLKKRYATFHNFKNSKKIRSFNKTTSFIL